MGQGGVDLLSGKGLGTERESSALRSKGKGSQMKEVEEELSEQEEQQ